VDLERHLHANGTRIVKFYLHLSKDEQRKRFLARIDEPEKNWKFSLADIKERKFWKQYMTAFEDCLSATSTSDIPWYVVPADDKQNPGLSSPRSSSIRSTASTWPTPKRARSAGTNCSRSANNSRNEISSKKPRL